MIGAAAQAYEPGTRAASAPGRQPPARRRGRGASPGAGRGHRPPNPAAQGPNWTPRTTPSPTQLLTGPRGRTVANIAASVPSDRAAGRLKAIHGGAGEAKGAGSWVPGPPGHATPGCALGNESPAARGAGGCQVVGAGPRLPELGRNWVATGPKPKPSGLVGPRARCRGRARRGGQPGLLIRHLGHQG
jgi:hypothetical protein